MTSAIVVGAGVFGAALARRLAMDGLHVTLIDQDEPGHLRAASSGRTRLIRCSHGEDRWYLRSARHARSLWRDLEEETGTDLYEECGVVWFAADDGGWEAASERSLRDEGVPVQRLGPGDIAGLFPDVHTDDLAFAVYEPEAGVLRAQRAIRTLVESARRRAVDVRRGRAAPAAGAVELDGERLDADLVVWACGAWLGRLFPDLLDLRVSRQDVVFVAAGREWSADRVPAWVDHGGAAYGVGDLDGAGFKAAWDVDGPEFDPDDGDRSLDPRAEQAIREYLARRFPTLADAAVRSHRTCQYALTVDLDFVIAEHPEHPGVWLYGGGSGHGFKHGPALAEYAVRAMGGESAIDPRFGLERAPRRAGLRTAGEAGPTG